MGSGVEVAKRGEQNAERKPVAERNPLCLPALVALSFRRCGERSGKG